ncbi:hypothetical protein JW877_03475 [bacterium]|nr:hypothetical protein [bacterium]
MIFVIIALKKEFNYWVGHLTALKETTRKRLYTGTIRGKQILTTYGGLGYRVLHRLKEGIDNFPVEKVIVTGSAGALDPQLKIGDVIVGDRVISGNDYLESDILFLPEFKTPFQVKVGSILTVKLPVISVNRGRKLHLEYEADCVDMESYHIARYCSDSCLEWFAVRGISDLSNLDSTKVWHRNLPQVVENCFTVIESIIERI